MAPSKIVVDLREFNSKLPFLIHKTGIKIIPKHLEIADYIICSDTAIERKSLTDLVASLDDGRLYNQARNLTKNFSRPMLLIEFDNKKFVCQINGCSVYLISCVIVGRPNV